MSEKGRNIVQETPSKKRETLEKLRAVGERWKRVNKTACEKRDSLARFIMELEAFEEKYGQCMTMLQETSASITASRQSGTEADNLRIIVDDLSKRGQHILSQVAGHDRQSFEERLQKLFIAWQGILECKEDSEFVRQRELAREEKLQKQRIQSEAYATEIKMVTEWLKEAESTLKTDMFTVPEEQQMDEILKQEKLYNEMQQQQLLVVDILDRGRKLSSSMTGEEQETMRLELDKLSRRWDEVQKLSDEHGSRMEQCISEQADYYDQLEKCVVWMQEASESIAFDELDGKSAVVMKEKLSKHMSLCEEIEERESCVKAVLEKGKDLVEKLPKEEKGSIEEQLTRLKDEWHKLRQQAKEKENELKGNLGETFEEDICLMGMTKGTGEEEQLDDSKDLEDKQMDYGVDLVQFKEWLSNVMVTASKSIEASNVEDLESAVNDNVTLRGEAKSRLEDLVLKGQDLASKWRAKDTKATKNLEEQIEELKRDWHSTNDVLDHKAEQLQAATTSVRKAQTKVEKVHSLLEGVERTFDDCKYHDDFGAELKLECFQNLLREVEVCEANLADVISDGYELSSGLIRVEESLQSRISDLAEKITQVKGDISAEIEKDQDVLEEKNHLLEDLGECKGLMKNLEDISKEQVLFAALPVMEEQAVETAAALEASNSAFIKLRDRSQSVLARLGPLDQKALETELADITSFWENCKEKGEERLRNADERIQMGKEFDLMFNTCIDWAEKSKESLAKAVPSSGSPEIEEIIAKWKGIQYMSSAADGPVNAVLQKGEQILSKLCNNEKSLIEAQLSQLKMCAREVEDESFVKITGLEKQFEESQQFRADLKEFLVCVENTRKRTKELRRPKDARCLEENLAELKHLQEEAAGKTKELHELLLSSERIMKAMSQDERNSMEFQLENARKCHYELEQSLADATEEVEDQAVSFKELERALTQCKEVIKHVEDLLGIERPSHGESSQMETYVEELKGKFEKAVEQSSCLFKLEEKKDALKEGVLKLHVESEHKEIFDKWRTLAQHLSEKIAETEQVMMEEKALTASLGEFSKRVEDTEHEMLIMLEPPERVEEITERVAKVEHIGARCVSYENLVKSLHAKIENCPVELEGGFKEGKRNELCNLKGKVLQVKILVSDKLKEMEQCVSDVSDVSAKISASKEWLMQKKQLVDQEDPMFENSDGLEKKVLNFSKLDSEISMAMNNVNEAQKTIKERVEKVSNVIGQSLSGELDLVYSDLSDLHDKAAAILSNTETRVCDNKKAQRLLRENEDWLNEAEDLIRASASQNPNRLSETLGKLSSFQSEREEKEYNLKLFLRDIKEGNLGGDLDEQFKRTLGKFHHLKERLSKASFEVEGTIAEYVDCANQLKESLQWLTETATIVEQGVTLTLDGSAAEVELKQIMDFRPGLESVGRTVEAVLTKKVMLGIMDDANESDIHKMVCTLNTLRQSVKEAATKKEHILKTFLQSKENYHECVLLCTKMMEQIKGDEVPLQLSAKPEEARARVEEHKRHMEHIFEFENEIVSLEEAGKQMVYHSECFKESIQDQLATIKMPWQAAKSEAIQVQEEMESWIAEIDDLHSEMEECQSRLVTANTTLQCCEPSSTDVRGMNDFLGELKQVHLELQSCRTDIENTLEKGQIMLSKMKQNDKTPLEDSFKVLESELKRVEEETLGKIHQADRQINNIIEFDKESARCESLLTIYQAAAPVDFSCTVETLESQTDKLKRLYSDLEARESHMTALAEKGQNMSSGVSNEVSTSSDAKAGQLKSDWGQLKASIGEKLRELERLSQTKQEFENDFQKCFDGVLELENTMAVDVTGSVQERIEKTQQLCVKIESYRNKLDVLTDRCAELPSVAYEEQNIDPQVRLPSLVKRWEEVKEQALGKLNTLEQERCERAALVKDISAIQSLVLEANPLDSLPTDKESLEQTLQENTDFISTMEGNVELVRELTEKARNISEDSEKTSLLKSLHAVSKKLEAAKDQAKVRQEELQARLKQQSKIMGDIERCKILLENVKVTAHDTEKAFEDKSWVEEELAKQKQLLAKVETSKPIVTAVAKKVESLRRESEDSKETKLDVELRLLNEYWEEVHLHISDKITQLETFRNFNNDCSNLSSYYEKALKEIEELTIKDLNASGDLAMSEDSLAKCRLLQGKCVESNDSYKAFLEQSVAVLSHVPIDKKETFEAKITGIKVKREDLVKQLAERHEGLRNIVAEQQTLEGWFSYSRVLLEEGRKMLARQRVTVEQSERSQNITALRELLSRVEDYEAYNANCQHSGKESEFNKVKHDLTQLKDELRRSECDLQELNDLCKTFTENMEKLNARLDPCNQEIQEIGCPTSAKEHLQKVKV